MQIGARKRNPLSQREPTAAMQGVQKSKNLTPHFLTLKSYLLLDLFYFGPQKTPRTVCSIKITQVLMYGKTSYIPLVGPIRIPYLKGLESFVSSHVKSLFCPMKISPNELLVMIPKHRPPETHLFRQMFLAETEVLGGTNGVTGCVREFALCLLYCLQRVVGSITGNSAINSSILRGIHAAHAGMKMEV